MEPHLALLQRLESLQRAGVQILPKGAPFAIAAGVENSAADQQFLSGSPHAAPTPANIPRRSPSAAAVPAVPNAVSLPSPTPTPILSAFSTDLPDDIPGRQALLNSLQTQVEACKLCHELACTRKQTVFGIGNVRPRVVFFGEAPGADEDRQGEPFVGAAGQLLTSILAACTWQRSDVYIMNTLKCRPPANRNPEPKEVTNCRPFFERQLEILRPEYIVCLGAVAAHALLQTKDAVGKLRRNFHSYRGATVVVTYHPSYLLRNPDSKRQVWDDLKKMLNAMGVEYPGKQVG